MLSGRSYCVSTGNAGRSGETEMTIAVHRMSIYNPARLTDAEVIASFVARRGVFERIRNDLRQESDSNSAQHHMIVGQRGMGKTTLLMRFAVELRQSPWKERFVPLVFAEEQYEVDRLSKFWMHCLDSLADACERIGLTGEAEKLDTIVRGLEPRLSSKTQNEDALAREALQELLNAMNTLNRRPVLLVDNIQIVFERIGHQQHMLRELLMRPGAPILIAASPTPPSATLDYGQAFYDHFKTHYLKQLTAEEMRELILSLAKQAGRSDVLDNITRNPGRLKALHQLTGGNPRMAVLLFHLYAEDFSPTVFGDLELLLDRVTPLYKARFEELSPQMQVVAGAIANHWDPVATRDLTELTGLQSSQITSQLDRLQKLGFVEVVTLFDVNKKAPDSRKGYQLAERFFNVWYLMRSASRRHRRQIEFLTRFLESFYAAEERTQLARSLICEEEMSPDRMLYMQSLHDSINDSYIDLETKRLIKRGGLNKKKVDVLMEEHEVGYLSDIRFNPEYTNAYKSAGAELLRSHRYEEAEQLYLKAVDIEPDKPLRHHDLVFYLRDYKNDIPEARKVMSEMAQMLTENPIQLCLLQEALFAAYSSNSGITLEKIAAILDMDSDFQFGLDSYGRSNMVAVLIHLGYSNELLSLLDERGDKLRLRPWYEAIRAHHLGDRAYLQNVAPEIRSASESFFESIAFLLDSLPEATSRRSKESK